MILIILKFRESSRYLKGNKILPADLFYQEHPAYTFRKIFFRKERIKTTILR